MTVQAKCPKCGKEGTKELIKSERSVWKGGYSASARVSVGLYDYFVKCSCGHKFWVRN